MPKHEFYAEPTVFDHWQSSAECWFSRCGEKLAPYLWFSAFCGLALTFVVIAMGVFLNLVLYRFGVQPQGWNQAMAQGVTAITALLASQHLLYQAVRSLPDDANLPPYVWAVLDLVVGSATTGAGGRADRVKNRHPDRRDADPTLQEFFAGVRAAGVNVSVARTLFTAGIRSPRQLCARTDGQLLELRGIGPVTVRKLRQHFERS
ncbi:MAG: helix-hairpin-helix domain-containing protein [Thiogranum sp.]|nr:helix-hairpin-helix domain-containing protein [Thiogranum sp.]